MSNIDKFENWKHLNKKNESNENSKDAFQKYNLDWEKKYPELRMLKLTDDCSDNNCNWLYSLNKKNEKVNIDLFIEIEKNENWKINFELVLECEDEYLVNNKKDKSNTQDEKHYEKRNLDYEEFNNQLKKVCEYIRSWNQEFYKEWDFYPLSD